MTGGDTTPEPTPSARGERPYLPMAIGFHLLALPMFVAILLANDAVGRWTNAIAGVALVAIGVVLQRMRAR
jgi:hypothetical protein